MILSERATTVKSSAALNITAKAEKMKINGIDIINLGTGEPDFDTPTHIKKAAAKAIEGELPKNTDIAGLSVLREALCKKALEENGLSYTVEETVVTNGGKQALMNTVFSLVGQDDEVIISAPYWQSYIELVRLAGGVPVVVYTRAEHGFKLKASDIRAAVTDRTRAIIINSPNNPTGVLYSRKELLDIADIAEEKDIFIISDEVYDKMIYSQKEKFISIASLGEEIKKRTVVINSFSKTYSMTPWRIGYSFADRKISKIMKNIQSNCSSNVNVVSQYAALAALEGGDDCVTRLVDALKKRRDYMLQRISDIPYLRCIKPVGGLYILVDTVMLFGESVDGIKIESGRDIAKILFNKYNVAAVPGDVFGMDSYIRLSFAPSMEKIIIGVNRIENFIKQNF